MGEPPSSPSSAVDRKRRSGAGKQHTDGADAGADGSSLHRQPAPPPSPTRLQSALAGAIAGTVSRCIVAPLDLLKIRFQVQLEPVRWAAARGGGDVVAVATRSKYTGVVQALRTIVREEGFWSLWRGNVPALLLVGPYCAVQFSVNAQLKQLAFQWNHRRSSSNSETLLLPKPVISLGCGAGAGIAATIATYPLDLLRTTLAAQGHPPVYRGIGDAAVTLLRTRGLLNGWYNGIGPTLVQIVPYASLQFFTYDWAKAVLSRVVPGGGSSAGRASDPDPHYQGARSFLISFTSGLLAGIASKLAVHPLDVVKKRFQVAGLARSLDYGERIIATRYEGSMVNCLKSILREEGIMGLYKGTVPALLKAAPAAAITFAAYEIAIKLIVQAFD